MSVLSKLFGTATAGVGPVEAQDLLRHGAVLIDVREQQEWDAGHAPKARHHPLGSLATSMARLPEDRTLVVVCRSGHRSARATKMLASSGFDVVNLTGGMTAWKAAGLPMVNRRGRRVRSGERAGVARLASGVPHRRLARRARRRRLHSRGADPGVRGRREPPGRDHDVARRRRRRVARGHVRPPTGRPRPGLPGIMFGLAGIGGSVVGTRLNSAVDANLLLLAFAGLMLLAAWRMWVNQAKPGAGDEDFELYPEPEPPPGADVQVTTRTDR